MKNLLKILIASKKDIKSKNKEIKDQELEEKSELGLKNKNNEREEREEKRTLIKGDEPENEMNINKNDFSEYKNLLIKNPNDKGNKINLKKHCKNNKRINLSKNIYIMIIIFFNLIITNNNMIEYKFSNITLKITGPGEQDILFSNFYYSNPPDIICINGEPKNSKNHIYNFNKINNTVNLIWNNPINSSCRMFEQCSKITEIDLSNFDTSEVTGMSQMFSGCSQLTSINLTKFNTSKVQRMHSMFMSCSQLTSLDLSSFDTSNVQMMQYMFFWLFKISFFRFI